HSFPTRRSSDLSSIPCSAFLQVGDCKYGPCISMGELMLCDRAQCVRYQMEQLRDRVTKVRDVVPPEPSTSRRAWWKFWGTDWPSDSRLRLLARTRPHRDVPVVKGVNPMAKKSKRSKWDDARAPEVQGRRPHPV